jgi:hypothetical protein
MPSEYTLIGDAIPEIVAKTGVTHPNIPPYDHISLLIVAWNEEERIGGLIEYLKPWFNHSVVCVQESDDATLEIAQVLLDRPGDLVFKDKHWGHGDASLPRMVAATSTEWCFSVACDERPDMELLQSLHSATAYARDKYDGIWVPFHSSVEGIEYREQHGHLRLFRQRVGWPKTLHSRPEPRRALWWPYGFIDHVRSLDEMMQDYLRYYEIGRGNPGWDRHNLLMMHDACVITAENKGWPYVQKYEWWPGVAELAFTKEELDGIEEGSKAGR